MTEKNLLLSGGEKLHKTADIVRGNGAKKMPYSFDEVRRQILPEIRDVALKIEGTEPIKKARGEGVFELTLHPAFLARTYYPSSLLRKAGLRDVGSKEKFIKPRTSTKRSKNDQLEATTTIFVAGQPSAIKNLGDILASDKTPEVYKKQFREIESISIINPLDKIKGELPEGLGSFSFEVALHADGEEEDVVISFNRFAKSIEAYVDLSRKIRVGGLTFLPVEATSEQLRKLAEFSFLRVARLMPILRIADPAITRITLKDSLFNLPTEKAIIDGERVAIFDGGLGSTDLEQWANEFTYHDTTATAGSLLSHGNEVTSTFLFGRPSSDSPKRPYMGVDHFRVLSPTSGRDPDLFDVLHRVKNALETGRYRFANLSLGPHMPICDDEVHTWTATLDQLSAVYGILITVAVGNDGDVAGANRIQPPGDMVNALAVGSCDSPNAKWKRAEYSCIGPGRSPGLVKPDGVAFGGDEKNPFDVFNPLSNSVVGVAGTSYSSPLALRTAVGTAVSTEHELSTIALKALMIHQAETLPRQKKTEVGWGRFKENPIHILECGPASATIIFNGLLAKGEYRRCPIPFPDLILPGELEIKATFCISANTDPEHSGNYTRSGMGISFRPKLGLDISETTEFFGIGPMKRASERELRDSAHKWETVQHRSRLFKSAAELAGPVFDVEYNSREESKGVPAASAPDIEYALVVTVHAPDVPNLYSLIRTKYPILTPVEIRSEIQLAA